MNTKVLQGSVHRRVWGMMGSSMINSLHNHCWVQIGEKISKIGQHLPKLWAIRFFMKHGVYHWECRVDNEQFLQLLCKTNNKMIICNLILLILNYFSATVVLCACVLFNFSLFYFFLDMGQLPGINKWMNEWIRPIDIVGLNSTILGRTPYK